MDRHHDLERLLQSRIPIIVIETGDEPRVLGALKSIALGQRGDDYLPLFRWSVTDGLQRMDIELEPQLHNADPEGVLRHIRAVTKNGVYALLDFHPYLQDPVIVRLLKDICIRFSDARRHLVLVSHSVVIPSELEAFTAKFELTLPSAEERDAIIKRVAAEYAGENDASVHVDPKAYSLLLDNLSGLSAGDTERLARTAIFQDGAISKSDLPKVMRAKYELLNRGGILHFEYDTARFGDVGGLTKMKRWLAQRKDAFLARPEASHLDAPRGILLTGVQGCGKSLAAKAIAGVFGLPLLRMDFGSLFNKYHGETERHLRESLETANVMAPCVLWIDEIEKALAGQGSESGTAQRVLATLLTWLEEKNDRVFVVSTANDITGLPPELVRKGRFDEIFFVDLPDPETRRLIFEIHLRKRGLDSSGFAVDALAGATEGFSGAEIEQAIVSALYAAHARKETTGTAHVLEEIERTRPLSTVMRERIESLRRWADGRTVAAH